MSTTYIFAIGGTGSRVLRSFTMLLASGCKYSSADTEIVPIIFDYDTTNGDLCQKTEPLLKKYAEIHDDIYKNGDTDKNTFFCNPLIPIRNKKVDHLQGPIVTNNQQFNPQSDYAAYIDSTHIPATFADFLGYQQMVNELEPTRLLLDSLYNNDPETSPATEINMDFAIGFKGCPNIGCMVADYFTQTPEYEHFRNVCRPGNGDKVIIIASVFGGTGASGIPIFLNSIRRDVTGGQTLPVTVVAMTPYYTIRTQNGGVIDSKTFIAKFHAAMDAYALQGNVNQTATRIYYVGDPDPQLPFNYCDGGTQQQNPSVFAELLGASCIMHAAGEQYGIGPVQAFEVGLDDTIPMSYYSTNERGETVHIPITPNQRTEITWEDFTDAGDLLNAYLYPLRRLTLFSNFCSTFIPNKTRRKDVWYYGPELGVQSEEKALLQHLKEFNTLYFQWLKELHSEYRPLHLLNPDCQGDNFEDLMDNYRIKGSLLWKPNNEEIADTVQDHFGNLERSHSYTNGRNAHLFIRAAQAAINDIDIKINEKKQPK